MEDQEAEEPENKRPLLERNVFAAEDDFEDEIIEETTPLEWDVLGPKDAKGNAIILGKAFRSHELSEEALKEPEKQAPKEQQLEEAWSKEEEQHFLKTTLGQATIAALSLIVIAGLWALITLGSEETADSSEQRAQILEQKNLHAKSAEELNVQKDEYIKLCVKNYLEATTYEERAKYCRNPDATLEKMMAHQRKGNAFQKYHYTGELAYNEIFLAGGIPVVIASASNSVNANTTSDKSEIEFITLLLEAQPDGTYAVDWETDAVYQPNDWDQFISTKSTEPKTFRVNIIDSNNLGPYLYAFNDDKVYQAYRVSTSDKPNNYLLAYAKKNSDIDNKLKQALKIDPTEEIRTVSKLTATMILTLSFPENANSDQCVEILEINSDSWYQP